MKKSVKIDQFVRAGKKDLGVSNYEGALKNFMNALEIDEDDSEVHYFLGITYARMGEYDSAEEYLDRVLHSELAYIHKIHTQMILGYIYTIGEDYKQALSFFKEIISGGVESAQAYAAVGYIMDRMGNFKDAILNLYHAIEIEPRNANAHNSLGFIFAEANLNLDEALKECKKAVSIDKQNPAYLDSLGWVYYKLGELSQAKSYLKKAIKLAPHNKEIKRHLEIVMVEIGA